MDNPEEILQLLERFTKLKQKEIPRELEEYLNFVARTGDTVYRWAVVKQLFREKLVTVITDFHDNSPSITDLPQYPNVDPFNYERMKRILLERLDAFNSAPFTVQRICELLTEPRKQYSRIDKFMRAVEKNILVVSTQEPGRRRSDSENGDSLDSIVNGELEVNVDIEMDNDTFGGIDSHVLAPEPIITTDPIIASTSKECQDNVENKNEDVALKKGLEEVNILNEVKAKLVELNNEKMAEEILPEATPEEESKIDIDVDEKVENDILNSIVDTAETTTVDKMHAIVETIAEPDISIEELPKVEEVKESIIDSKPDEAAVVEKVEENISVEEPKKIEAEINAEQDDEPLPKIAKIEEAVVEKEPESAAVSEVATETAVAQNSPPIDEKTAEVESSDDSNTNSSSSLSDVVSDSNSGETPAVPQPVVAVEKAKEDEVLVEETNPIVPETAPVVAAEASKEDLVEVHVEKSNEVILPEVKLDVIEPAEVTAPSDATTVEIKDSLPAPIPDPVEVPLVKTTKTESEVQPTVPLPTTTDTDEMETSNVGAAVAVENVMATDEEELHTAAISTSTTDIMPMAADSNDNPKTEDNAMDVDENSGEPMDQ